MNKRKFVRKKGYSQFVLKGIKGQQINERELYVINNIGVSGLLHMDAERRGSSFDLIYNVTGFISFREFLRAPLNKQSFARLLKGIIVNLQAMDRAFFNQEYVLLDFDYIMVNPATQGIFFIYVPIQGFQSNTTLKGLLAEIAQKALFVPGEDTSYIREYIDVLNRSIYVSVFELEEYINKLLGQNQQAAEEMIECPRCHMRLKKGTNFCLKCGVKIGDSSAMKRALVYNPPTDDGRGFPSMDKLPVKPTPPPVWTPPSLQDNDTTVLVRPGSETTVLGFDEPEKPLYPYLIRTRTQEKIPVNKPCFRIGKERQFCDYFVMDNTTVSRSHADIITEGKRYYIIDRNSTNGTSVDGRRISKETQVEIYHKTKICLSNEDFTFYIES